MSGSVACGASSRSGVTFEIHLYWASWAAPSLPAPLTARELHRVLPSNVAVHVHDVSLSTGTGHAESAIGEFAPRVLPTWRIIARNGRSVIGERVLTGAHPKFTVREALDELRSALDSGRLA